MKSKLRLKVIKQFLNVKYGCKFVKQEESFQFKWHYSLKKCYSKNLWDCRKGLEYENIFDKIYIAQPHTFMPVLNASFFLFPIQLWNVLIKARTTKSTLTGALINPISLYSFNKPFRSEPLTLREDNGYILYTLHPDLFKTIKRSCEVRLRILILTLSRGSSQKFLGA